ncbi:MAG: hypothetical protein ACXWQE_00655 [Bdellovibrionales bacterium]
MISLLFMSAAWAHDSSVTVIETSPELEIRFNDIAKTFAEHGSAAVAESIQGDVLDPEAFQQWKFFAESGEVKIVEVKIHPNEAAAVDWMNQRFQRMGLPNFSLQGVEDETLPDPTALDPKQIERKKWLRYSAGPGVAAAAFLLNLPSLPEGEQAKDYLYLLIPAASAGFTTVALEMQFAWPWLNNVFWKKVWKSGGAIGGRATNVFVNFLYGMSIYGATYGGEHLANALGAGAFSNSMGFTQAVVGAGIGAVTFHLAMGQYQTDIAREEERGSITAGTRYGMETNGVLVNNSARVLSWVLPGGTIYGSFAQAAFFLFKTFPQLLKTNITDLAADREVARKLNPEASGGISTLESCAKFLARLPLIPTLRK